MTQMKNKKIPNPKKDSSKKSLSNVKLKKKIKEYQNIIQETILSVQNYKSLDIIEKSDFYLCVHNLENLFSELTNLSMLFSNKKKLIDYDDVSDRLDKIKMQLIENFRLYGTKNIETLINLVFDEKYLGSIVNDNNKYLYDIIKKYTHPINFKIMGWKEKNSYTKNEKIKQKLAKNRIVEDFMIVEEAGNLDCFDLARTQKNFQTKVYGVKICFQNISKRKTLIVSVITDNMMLSCMNQKYVSSKLVSLHVDKPTDPSFMTKDFSRFVDSLTLKDILVYNNKELYHRYQGYLNQTKLIKKKTISQIVKEFIGSELYGQRRTLIQMLMKHNDPEFQYLAYLLYDLLNNNEQNGNFDTQEQATLYDSLPWHIKKFFKDAMRTTEKYTRNLTNFDTSKIPIEQQICLMKASDSVKEKAMLKLKEVKAKSEDSGSKARQYLDGLLKIPFGIYKKESILSIIPEINEKFKTMVSEIIDNGEDINIPKKEKYSTLEIEKYTKYLEKDYFDDKYKSSLEKLIEAMTHGKRDKLVSNICLINSILKKSNQKKLRILHSGKKISYMKEHIRKTLMESDRESVLMKELMNRHTHLFKNINTVDIKDNLDDINESWNQLTKNMNEITDTLNDSIYGHDKAKRQIQRVIGQWVTGKQSGYCFGFEGAPGIGKTSLARKGLAYCLKDADGTTRPFSFIALGGSSNGSTLSGHNYTYVGSTWGRIVDILMENKCMNPIIFIDELDKVSKTENGKEIIGILTHLIDPTQNESFQDKYFSGIDIDMSKALFIFSYNDVSVIDKILLDRIHRIKFDNLTLHDKLEITERYILPELFEKVGLENTIEFSTEILKFIIETYTRESGVRKLKEILFEIISEINLEILNNKMNSDIPIVISKQDVKNKYLKERIEVIHKEIHNISSVGIMNGLWANALGMGGIIPIECNFWPSNTFMDFKLTGLQGDVMKESMNVAKTLSWKLTSDKVKKKLRDTFEKTKLQGIHIHCPEGAVPKDGPSAGTAITTAIYSLLNNKKIKNDVAITGEINLQGRVTIIGGLELKILGGIRAGVKTFIFPKQNVKDYDKIIEKYKDKNVIPEEIKFISVEHISEVLDIVFV